jgi:hypothetical protein
MKEGIIKDTYELLIKEIQTVITLSYIFAVGIGMLFNYQKYSWFGINIFDYGTVFDFLMAPFADLYVMFFSVLSILVVYALFVFDSYWKKKWPERYTKVYRGIDKKPWYNLYRNSMFAITLIIYLFTAAYLYGVYSRYTIVKHPDVTITMADNELKTGKLIGKTNNVLFLLNDSGVYAIPFSSLVKELKIK